RTIANPLRAAQLLSSWARRLSQQQGPFATPMFPNPATSPSSAASLSLARPFSFAVVRRARDPQYRVRPDSTDAAVCRWSCWGDRSEGAGDVPREQYLFSRTGLRQPDAQRAAVSYAGVDCKQPAPAAELLHQERVGLRQ